MINALHLLWIVPVSFVIGGIAGTLFTLLAWEFKE